MSSLITTMIAIALTALIAVAGLFYGADHFLGSRDDATAAQIINGSSQVTGAIDLYRTRNAGSLPKDAQQLVSEGYLTGLPAGDWTFTEGAVQRPVLTDAQCGAVNQRVHNDAAINTCASEGDGFVGCCTKS